MRKSVFKELVTFIVALSSSKEVQGLPFPICSQQSSFYVSLSVRKEKKDTQSERYRTPIEKTEKRSWRQRKLIAGVHYCWGIVYSKKWKLRRHSACEEYSQEALLVLIKKNLIQIKKITVGNFTVFCLFVCLTNPQLLFRTVICKDQSSPWTDIARFPLNLKGDMKDICVSKWLNRKSTQEKWT